VSPVGVWFVTARVEQLCSETADFIVLGTNTTQQSVAIEVRSDTTLKLGTLIYLLSCNKLGRINVQ
jgi:hypothetical protein